MRLGIASEVPYSYIDEDTGDLTGMAPAIAEVIFGRLGVDNFQPVLTEFGSLIPGLRSMQFDVVAAGMGINPDRCGSVIFSDPDHAAMDAFIVEAGNPLGLENYADLVESGAQIATGPGWYQQGYALDSGVDPDNISTFPDQLAGMLAVEQGRIDAFMGMAPTIGMAAEGSSTAESTGPFVPVINGEEMIGGGAFGFHPNETKLRDAFNEELYKLKDSGELLGLVEPFGFTEDEMTDLTAEELCQQ